MAALAKLGFPDDITHAIKNIYRGAYSWILVGGVLYEGVFCDRRGGAGVSPLGDHLCLLPGLFQQVD